MNKLFKYLAITALVVVILIGMLYQGDGVVIRSANIQTESYRISKLATERGIVDPVSPSAIYNLDNSLLDALVENSTDIELIHKMSRDGANSDAMSKKIDELSIYKSYPLKVVKASSPYWFQRILFMICI